MITASGIPEMGAALFRDACAKGTRDPATAYLVCYARYLNHGGNADEWLKLDPTDVSMMNLQYDADRDATIEGASILIANAIGRLFVGDDKK